MGSSWRLAGFSLVEHTSSVVAGRGLSCPAVCGIFISPPGMEPPAPCIAGWILNHWTTKEVPRIFFFNEEIYPCLIKGTIQHTFSHDQNSIGLQYVLMSCLDFPRFYFLRKKRAKALQSTSQIQWDQTPTLAQGCHGPVARHDAPPSYFHIHANTTNPSQHNLPLYDPPVDPLNFLWGVKPV